MMDITQTPGHKPEGREIDAMRKRLGELTFLHQTSQVLTATLDLDSVLRSLMAQVRDYFQVEAASVALLDEETGELAFRVAVGEAANEVVGLRLAPGQGIPPELGPRIFDRFARLENAEGIKGTGLGLAFCKLAVEGIFSIKWGNASVTSLSF